MNVYGENMNVYGENRVPLCICLRLPLIALRIIRTYGVKHERLWG